MNTYNINGFPIQFRNSVIPLPSVSFRPCSEQFLTPPSSQFFLHLSFLTFSRDHTCHLFLIDQNKRRLLRPTLIIQRISALLAIHYSTDVAFARPIFASLYSALSLLDSGGHFREQNDIYFILFAKNRFGDHV